MRPRLISPLRYLTGSRGWEHIVSGLVFFFGPHTASLASLSPSSTHLCLCPCHTPAALHHCSQPSGDGCTNHNPTPLSVASGSIDRDTHTHTHTHTHVGYFERDPLALVWYSGTISKHCFSATVRFFLPHKKVLIGGNNDVMVAFNQQSPGTTIGTPPTSELSQLKVCPGVPFEYSTAALGDDSILAVTLSTQGPTPFPPQTPPPPSSAPPALPGPPCPVSIHVCVHLPALHDPKSLPTSPPPSPRPLPQTLLTKLLILHGFFPLM